MRLGVGHVGAISALGGRNFGGFVGPQGGKGDEGGRWLLGRQEVRQKAVGRSSVGDQVSRSQRDAEVSEIHPRSVVHATFKKSPSGYETEIHWPKTRDKDISASFNFLSEIVSNYFHPLILAHPQTVPFWWLSEFSMSSSFELHTSERQSVIQACLGSERRATTTPEFHCRGGGRERDVPFSLDSSNGAFVVHNASPYQKKVSHSKFHELKSSRR